MDIDSGSLVLASLGLCSHSPSSFDTLAALVANKGKRHEEPCRPSELRISHESMGSREVLASPVLHLDLMAKPSLGLTDLERRLLQQWKLPLVLPSPQA